jgi:hypothetical protein
MASQRWYAHLFVSIASALAFVACGGGGGGGGSQATFDGSKATLTVSDPFGAVADGLDVVTITVTALDSKGTPVPGLMVELNASGSGNLLTQPSATTDASGVATGTLRTTMAEIKSISAVFDPGTRDIPCAQEATAQFVWPLPATLYVRTSGDDLRSGTNPADAFRTLGKAVSIARPGDTIYVGAGTYPESLVLSLAGTAADPIALVADTSGATTGDAGTVTIDAGGTQFGVKLDGSSNVTLRGFTLRSAIEAGIWASGARSSTIGIDRCTIYGCASGIVVEGGDGFSIESCVISNQSGPNGDGIALTDADGFLIENDLIYDNAGSGLVLLGSCQGLMVNLCTFYSNAGDQVLEAAGGNDGIVRNSIVSEGLADGVHVLVGSSLEERNNLLWNNAGDDYDDESNGAPHPSDVLANPLLIDPAGGDGVLGSGSADDSFLVETTSPTIDAGDALAEETTLSFGSWVSGFTNRADGFLDGTLPDGDALNLGWHVPATLDALPLLGPDGVRLFYGRGDEVQILSRSWAPQSGAWTTPARSFVGSTGIRWASNRISPLSVQEELLAVYTDDGTATQLHVRLWDGARWTTGANFAPIQSQIASAHSGQRGFDVEYEQSSGDGIVVWSNDTSNPVYRALSRGVWSEDASVFQASPGTGSILWVELVARRGTDEVALVCLDDQSKLTAIVWDGTQWDQVSATLLDDEIITTTASQAFDAAYESVSGDLLVVWGFTGLIEETRQATKAAGTTLWVQDQSHSTDAVGAIMRLASDPTSDRIACAVSEGQFGKDTVGMVWDGSIFGNIAEFDLFSALDARDITVGWVGDSGTAVFVYKDDDGAGTLDWARFTSSGWRIQTDVALPGVGDLDFIESASLESEDLLFVALSDEDGQLWALTTNGSSWTLTNAGGELEGALSALAGSSQPFTLDVNR